MQIKIPPDLTIFHDCLQTDTVLQLKETLGSRVMLVEPSKIKLISMDQFTNKVTKVSKFPSKEIFSRSMQSTSKEIFSRSIYKLTNWCVYKMDELLITQTKNIVFCKG
ncbi:hypothetical protein GJ496_005891 [Pomphorhynchus laevis]|nr:hypothetical protein GJ496_005891 [Pomphorhynchus laevis]